MTNIGAFEAKTHLSRLLEQVAAGEKFVITRHGKPVAQLVPIESEDNAKRLRREAAIVRLKTVGDGNRLERITIRQLIDEGRKF
jgi:prevent-host-death family protein